MSLIERVVNLLLEYNAEAEALQRQVDAREKAVRTAEEEKRTALEVVAACQRERDQKHRQRVAQAQVRDQCLADLQAACDRLGIEGPNAP